MENESVRDTYNTFFLLHKKQILNTCDPELAGILAKHIRTEENYLKVLSMTYDLYKKYRSQDPHKQLFWDGFMRDSDELYAGTCGNQMYADILVYLAGYFEKKAKENKR